MQRRRRVSLTMILQKIGRAFHLHQMMVGALLVVSCLCSISCREKLPVNVQSTPSNSFFQLVPGEYFGFDNWRLDFYGVKIPSSYFRSSWTVVDTGKAIRGWTRVTIVADSTFDTTSHFVNLDSLLFRVGDDGDIYQYGFLKSLIAVRETLNIAPQWDRIVAFSQPIGNSWVIMRIDSSMGGTSNETVNGRISQNREYVGPVTINGEDRAVLSYRIEITEPRLDYTFWLTDAPTSVARVFDNSEILSNATLKELKTIKTSVR